MDSLLLLPQAHQGVSPALSTCPGAASSAGSDLCCPALATVCTSRFYQILCSCSHRCRCRTESRERWGGGSFGYLPWRIMRTSWTWGEFEAGGHVAHCLVSHWLANVNFFSLVVSCPINDFKLTEKLQEYNRTNTLLCLYSDSHFYLFI